jgi:hypothetical protein
MATKAKPKTTRGGGEFYLFGVRLLEKFIEFIKGVLTADVLNFSVKWLTKIGHIGLLAAAALGFLFGIIAAIRAPANGGTLFMYVIVFVIAVFVLQYTAYRFLPTGDSLIANNPTRLASKAFLDCVGFLAMLAGIVVLFFQIYVAIKLPSLTAFLTGLGVFIFLEFVALIAFNAETASMEIVEEASAGQEAIGIITFFMKTLLRLVPIAFGIGIAVFTVVMFIDSFGLFSDAKFVMAVSTGMRDATQILTFALLPFLAYIVFVLFFLLVDVIRSILAIPSIGK